MHRAVAALVAASLAALLAACGSSTQTVTGPSTNKCAVTATADTSSFGPGGGSGNITVSTNRECQWTAEPSSAWVALRSGSSGQGDGKVAFSVAANPDPATRRALVNVNDQQVAISQDAAACQFTVSPLADTVSPAGDRRTVAVSASSPQCPWTAKSGADWITIVNGAPGSGNGTVTYEAQPTTGPPRSGSLTVAGQTVSVSQGTGCSVAISPTGAAIGAAGGAGSISVNAGQGCSWTATTSVSWIALASGSTGAGPGTVAFTVSPWNGPARTGTIVVNGQVFTVTQGAGCSFSLSTSSTTISAGGGTGTVQLMTADGCSWNSSSNAAWIAIVSGGSGSGNGTVQFSVAANSGPTRTGTLTIGGQTFTVSQGSGCSIDISPTSKSFDASSGSDSVQVSTAAGCSWAASASVAWISIASGASGSGPGAVGYSVAANLGPARTGTLTIGGRVFTINQSGGCSFSINPSSQSFDSGGGAGSISVTGGGGCAWSASASQPWVHITSGSSGSGSGTVQFSVDANAGSARDATITAAGLTFSVHQTAGCSYSLSATSASIGAGGGTGSVSVTTGGGCTWSALAPDTWARITSVPSGNGSGAVQFTVDANSGAARSSTLTIAGIAFTISQDGAPCTYSISPAGADYPDAATHTGSFALTASNAGCAWTASASDAWIQITSATSGAGGATISYAIGANNGPARSGTISVAGQTYTITQASGCAVSIAPTSQAIDVAGGGGTIAVTTGAACGWTATAGADWITITSGASGTGNGTVTFTVATNPGTGRTGTITVGGQVFTVVQAGTAEDDE